jgi:polysaccharide deacetylase family protein (PEP-CTERM system associated)
MSIARKRVCHHFTVDVEEYFQVLALEPHIPRAEWDVLPSRLGVGLRALLDILSEHDVLATFFVLGWIADRRPELVREISARGHEVASHGSDHRLVNTLTKEGFRESVRTSKSSLENIVGRPIFGYRAPNFSIGRGEEWAFEILFEEGYRYDSSISPGRKSAKGFVRSERDPYCMRLGAGTLHEIPLATLKIGNTVLPAGGGAYFRHLPYRLVHSALRSAERRGMPGTFYIHPWELDTNQPRIRAPFLTRLRHYGGLARTAPRLERLLSAFRFQPIGTTLGIHDPIRSAK